MAPHIGILTTICLNLLAYDPNYNYEVIFFYYNFLKFYLFIFNSIFQEENDDDEDRDMETEEEDEDNEEEYSDDDDMSWKVVKLLQVK